MVRHTPLMADHVFRRPTGEGADDRQPAQDLLASGHLAHAPPMPSGISPSDAGANFIPPMEVKLAFTPRNYSSWCLGGRLGRRLLVSATFLSIMNAIDDCPVFHPMWGDEAHAAAR